MEGEGGARPIHGTLVDRGVARAKLNENRAFINNRFLESTPAAKAELAAKIAPTTRVAV